MHLRSIVIHALLVACLLACRKKKNEECHDCVPATENQHHPEDPTYTTVYAESNLDQISKSVATLFSNNTAYSFCGGNVDTLIGTSQDTSYAIYFNPSITCSDKGAKVKRAGRILLRLSNGKNWSEKGATITYEYQRFQVACDTCRLDNPPFEINGFESRTNLTGGTETDLQEGQTFAYEIYARNLTYSYPDKSNRVTNIREKVEIARKNDELMTYITGIDTVETGAYKGKTNVAFWGKIWNGKDFHVSYLTPKTYKTCNGKGKIVCAHVLSEFYGAYTKTEIFGVDKANPSLQSSCNCATTSFVLSTITKGDSTVRTFFSY